MKTRKLIRKMATPTAVIFIFSVIMATILENPYRASFERDHVERLNQYIDTLTQQNQEYLMKFAEEITTILDQAEDISHTKIVNDIQSQLLLEHQKINQTKRYLWMTDDKGEFIFGAPSNVFTQLNSAFDLYYGAIKNNRYFKDKNDFLIKTVDQYDRLDFSKFDTGEFVKKYLNQQERNKWFYIRSRTFILSTRITTSDSKLAGTLFLKIDDSVHHKTYYKGSRAWNRTFYGGFVIFFGVLIFVSGVFLWFLLPTWVYIDAQQRGVANPGIWAFITLISLIFGLAVYLITRPSTLKTFICPDCENELDDSGAFCPHCGFDLSNTFCPQCQYPIKQDWTFCPNCRAEMTRLRRPDLSFGKDKNELDIIQDLKDEENPK